MMFRYIPEQNIMKMLSVLNFEKKKGKSILGNATVKKTVQKVESEGPFQIY